jgi:hypothetical protein
MAIKPPKLIISKIEPLYPTVPQAAKKDKEFYCLVALVDAIRVGRSREYRLATNELKKRIFGK